MHNRKAKGREGLFVIMVGLATENTAKLHITYTLRATDVDIIFLTLHIKEKLISPFLCMHTHTHTHTHTHLYSEAPRKIFELCPVPSSFLTVG